MKRRSERPAHSSRTRSPFPSRMRVDMSTTAAGMIHGTALRLHQFPNPLQAGAFVTHKPPPLIPSPRAMTAAFRHTPKTRYFNNKASPAKMSRQIAMKQYAGELSRLTADTFQGGLDFFISCNVCVKSSK